MNESATPLVTMLVVFRTNIESINEDECSVKCVGSRISWFRLYCCISIVGSVNAFIYFVKVVCIAVSRTIKSPTSIFLDLTVIPTQTASKSCIFKSILRLLCILFIVYTIYFVSKGNPLAFYKN